MKIVYRIGGEGYLYSQFAERDTRRDDGGGDRRGAKAFAGAARLEIDADADVAAYRVSRADGRLDVRI